MVIGMKRTLMFCFLITCVIAAGFPINISFAAPDNEDVLVEVENGNTIFNIFEPFSSIEAVIQAAQLCSSGTPQNLFFDGFEAGIANWQSKLEVGTQDPWTISTTFPYAGSIYSLLGADLPSTSLTCKEMITAVTIPANSFINFQHAHDFEYFSDDPSYFEYFDGGVVEFSTDGGTTWNDAGPLFKDNGYNATGDNTISSSSGNPLGGRNAYGGFSLYKSSTVNLSSLSGKSVLFRFCIGTDSSNDIGSPIGWFIDNVLIYQCAASTTTIKPTTSIILPTTSSVLPSTSIVPVTTVPASTTTSVVPPPTTSTSSTATSSVSVTTSVSSTTTTSIASQCPLVAISGGDRKNLSLLRQYRDRVLKKTLAGKHYIRLFYAHSIELTRIMLNNPAITADARSLLNSLMPNIKAAVEGKVVIIRQTEINKTVSVLNEIGSQASPALYEEIQKVKRDLTQNKVFSKMGIKVGRR